MKRSILLFGAMLLAVSMTFSQNAFYTQDFGSGIPGGWTNSGGDKNGTTQNNMWKYTTTGNHSKGGWPTTALASPTSGNGWIIFDSDSLNSATNPVAAPQNGYLITTPINCSGHNNVLLQFYQLYFSLLGDPQVIVSNGTTNDTIDVNSDYNFTFGMTPNPSKKQYDITAIAANQSAVTLTFYWPGNATTYTGFLFYWQVDDISLIDAPASDLQFSQDGGFPFNYTSYPLSELDTINYYGFVTNVGNTAQTNTKVAINVANGSNSIVFSDTSDPGVTLDVEIVSFLALPLGFLPTALGHYKNFFSTFADSANGLPYGNTDTTFFAVSDSVYAVDNGVYGGSIPIYVPASENGGTELVQEVASIFYLPNADTITSITTALDGLQSSGNNAIQGNVYSINNYQGSGAVYSCTPVIQTEVKVLTANDYTAPNVIGTVQIVPVNLRINNSTGASLAAVLQPGFYAVSISSVNDSSVFLVNGFKGGGVYNTPGGIINGGSLNPDYRDINCYLRANFGHGFNLLQAAFTHSPGSNPVKINQSIQFRGTTNNTGDANTVYSWTFASADSVYSVATNNYTGQNITYTFPTPDSVYICLNVTDNGNMAQSCSWLKVRDFGVGINEIAPLSDLTLVPNPTTGHVTISADGVDGMVSTSVIDLLGNVVYTFSNESNGNFTQTYDLSGLTSGIYIVKIENAGTVVTKKLSISKQ